MQLGVSGLRAEGDAIGVVSDNIANLNTPGFKRQRAEFQDVFNRGGSGTASGGGIRLGGIQQVFGQGSLNQTGLATDVALNGEGFFLVAGSVNGLTSTFYTRSGQFKIDPAGSLVDPTGLQVLGRAMRSDGTLTAAITPLTVPTGAIPAEATTALTVTANLDASAPAPIDAFDVQNPSTTSSMGTTIDVFDSLGAPHTLEIYFNNLGPGQWEYRAIMRGDDLDPNQPGTNVEVGSGSLSFTSDGALDTVSPSQPVTIDFAQASPGQIIEVGFGTAIADGGEGLDGTTQFSMPGGVSSQSQNGFASGALTGINIAADGTVLGLYTNGRSVPVGQLQVAKFRATDALARAGNNLWVETAESGAPAVAAPGAGGRGQVSAGSLEASNVDLGEEMVTLIAHQRAFSANSRVIASADEMLSQLMQLKR
jgi:flagellar hook protein FlgE